LLLLLLLLFLLSLFSLSSLFSLYSLSSLFSLPPPPSLSPPPLTMSMTLFFEVSANNAELRRRLFSLEEHLELPREKWGLGSSAP